MKKGLQLEMAAYRNDFRQQREFKMGFSKGDYN